MSCSFSSQIISISFRLISFHSCNFISFLVIALIQWFIRSFIHACMHSFNQSVLPFVHSFHSLQSFKAFHSFHFMSFSFRFISFIHSFHFISFISFHFITLISLISFFIYSINSIYSIYLMHFIHFISLRFVSFHFVHSLIHSFIHSLIHSFIHPFTRSFMHACIHSFLPFVHSFHSFQSFNAFHSFHFISCHFHVVSLPLFIRFIFISFSFRFISFHFKSFISFFHSFHSFHPFNVFFHLISTAKSGPHLVCFVHFHFEMCFAPQRRALFRHRNFQKWSENGVFCTFWLRNVLRATTACIFSSLIWPAGSAPAALASLLFDSPEPQIIGKTQCFATFLPFRASASSFFWLFLFYSSLFSSFSSLCLCPTLVSSVHIVGSLTSKLPSITGPEINPR